MIIFLLLVIILILFAPDVAESAFVGVIVLAYWGVLAALAAGLFFFLTNLN